MDDFLDTEFQDSEEFIYKTLVKNARSSAIVNGSSFGVYVYRGLKDILYPSGRKSDILKHLPYKQPATIEIIEDNSLNMVIQLQNNGYNPLVMCTTEKPVISKSTGISQENDLLIRTTAMYSTRSTRYCNHTKKFQLDRNGHKIVRQCMTAFLPNLLLFKDNMYTPMEENSYRLANVCLVPGIDTMHEVNTANKPNIIKFKLDCVFDVALAQRYKEKPVFFDSLILTDLYTFGEECDWYVNAIVSLVKTYEYHFRKIVICSDLNTGLYKKLCDTFGIDQSDDTFGIDQGDDNDDDNDNDDNDDDNDDNVLDNDNAITENSSDSNSEN